VWVKCTAQSETVIGVCTVQSQIVIGVCNEHSAERNCYLWMYSVQCRVRLLLVCVKCTV